MKVAKKNIIRVWFMGFCDAWEQGGELSCGMTFGDPYTPLSVAYDRGANLAEWLYAKTHSQKEASN